eukprot:166360-Pelagomonas_calceolata.AAC.1
MEEGQWLWGRAALHGLEAWGQPLFSRRRVSSACKLLRIPPAMHLPLYSVKQGFGNELICAASLCVQVNGPSKWCLATFASR